MDHPTPSLTIPLSDNPVKIWVGSPSLFTLRCQEFLRDTLCAHNRCMNCRSCRLITQKSHDTIFWLAPDKGYTRAHIDELLHMLSFVRDIQTPFYCILEKAETLTTVCTNALLKSLEEPPPGYFFILGTQSLAPIAITLQSRAHIYYLSATKNTDNNKNCPLYSLFTQHSPPSCSHFLTVLDETAASWSEYELRQLCQSLLDYWVTYYQEILVTNPDTPDHTKCQRTITFLTRVLAHPFVPASTSFVLKDLFLSLFILPV